ncbi:hypothetical protein PF001_g13212 [Phytophthora fragariae]|uniref:RNase H type-1 domain-containing protein n=1 Tax=Phytophthora fragariae TaxID=53985 RepID=A0A6A4D907_9STRA|nr:hypothetical protein PF001_g13212 [Phytophthora fragariae]
MSYAAESTANKMAENMGLLGGLTVCNQNGYSPLHVVGDSEMIIQQQRTRQPPKAKHLTPLFWRCRRRLAVLQVLSWQHHLRAHNKMADSLANQAMDTRRSTQLRVDSDMLMAARWKRLDDLARGDVGHWILNNTDGDPTVAPVVDL